MHLVQVLNNNDDDRDSSGTMPGTHEVVIGSFQAQQSYVGNKFFAHR
jgi:hypothetical protein